MRGTAIQSDNDVVLRELVSTLMQELGLGAPPPKSSLTLHFDDHARLAASVQHINRKHPVEKKR